MNKKHMERAIALSREKMNSNVGGPFGAVIVKDGKIIAEGWNQVTSTNDPTAHAEVVAIRKAAEKLKSYELKGCEIYTSCEPCPMCLAAIYWSRLEGIYFGNSRQDAAAIEFDDEFLYREIQTSIELRKIPTTQLMRDEAIEVFNEWKIKPDKVMY